MKKSLTQSFVVLPEHSAKAIESGNLYVLSTPSLIGYVEKVARDLLNKSLDEEETSVGIEIQMKHLAPTNIGQTIRIVVNQIGVQRAIHSYQFEAYEGDVLIGEGNHKRAVVNAEKFMNRIVNVGEQ